MDGIDVLGISDEVWTARFLANLIEEEGEMIRDYAATALVPAYLEARDRYASPEEAAGFCLIFLSI